MDQEQITRIAETYSRSVTVNFRVKKIILYGSHAKGTATDESDIDIAVVVNSVEGDLLAAKAMLFQLRRDIDDRIEPILIEDDGDPSGFLRSILQTGKAIFDSTQ